MATQAHRSLTNSQAVPLPRSFVQQPGILVRLAETVRLWRRRARSRHELARLDARDLHDIGLSSTDAWQEYSKPFWYE